MTKLIVPGNNNFVVNDDGSVLLKDPLSIQPTADGGPDFPLTIESSTSNHTHFIGGSGTADGRFVLSLNAFFYDVNRDTVSGVFDDTGLAHARIVARVANADSHIEWSTIAANNTLASVRMKLDKNGHLLPGANKTQNLGATGTRWNTLYQGTSTAAGTSRIFASTRMCPVCDPPAQMIRGTGSLCILGIDRDYEVAMCPDCGILATEEMKHLPPEKLAERLPAPKIEFLGFHVFAMSGNSRKVRVDFRYKDEVLDENSEVIVSAILNSTYLGERELAEFLTMSEIDRTLFLQLLGQREWDAMEEARLIKEEVSNLQSQLDATIINLVGTDLK